MRSSDRITVWGLAARLAVRDYRVEYPPRVLPGAVLPRALLQVWFLTTLGRMAVGTDRAAAVGVGASAFVMCLATVVKAPDILIDERTHGTLYRLRMAQTSLFGIVAVRWLVYAVEGLVCAVLSLLVVALVLGDPAILRALPDIAPVYLLMAMTTSAFGMTVAAVALGRTHDVALTNLASYTLLAFCGVLTSAPAGTTWAAVAGALPLTHGIAAVRALMNGADALRELTGEALVGAVWLLAAALVLRHRQMRLRHNGKDA